MSLSELWSLYGQNYIDALLATWGMTLESFVIAMVLAVAVTVMRVSPLKPLRVFGDLYVQVFRNIPGIALLIIVVYALPIGKVTTVVFVLSIVARFLSWTQIADTLLWISVALSMVALIWYAVDLMKKLGTKADSTK